MQSLNNTRKKKNDEIYRENSSFHLSFQISTSSDLLREFWVLTVKIFSHSLLVCLSTLYKKKSRTRYTKERNRVAPKIDVTVVIRSEYKPSHFFYD